MICTSTGLAKVRDGNRACAGLQRKHRVVAGRTGVKQVCATEIGLVARQRQLRAVGLVFEVARGIERQQHRHRTASDPGEQACVDGVQLHQRGRRARIPCRHAPLAGERKSGSDRRAGADLGAELIDNRPPFDADGRDRRRPELFGGGAAEPGCEQTKAASQRLSKRTALVFNAIAPRRAPNSSARP